MSPNLTENAGESEEIRGLAPPAFVFESQEAFHRDLDGLLKTHSNQWVAYDRSTQIGIADTEIDLIRLCWDLGYKDKHFLTFSIEPECPVEIDLEGLIFREEINEAFDAFHKEDENN